MTHRLFLDSSNIADYDFIIAGHIESTPSDNAVPDNDPKASYLIASFAADEPALNAFRIVGDGAWREAIYDLAPQHI